MLVVFIFNFGFWLIETLFNLIPTINFIEQDFFGITPWFHSIFNTINYFVPVRGLLLILGFKISFRLSSIIARFVKLIINVIRGSGA